MRSSWGSQRLRVRRIFTNFWRNTLSNRHFSIANWIAQSANRATPSVNRWFVVLMHNANALIECSRPTNLQSFNWPQQLIKYIWKMHYPRLFTCHQIIQQIMRQNALNWVLNHSIFVTREQETESILPLTRLEASSGRHPGLIGLWIK